MRTKLLLVLPIVCLLFFASTSIATLFPLTTPFSLTQTGVGTSTGSALTTDVGGEIDLVVSIFSGVKSLTVEIGDGTYYHSQQVGVLGQSSATFDGVDSSSAVDTDGLGGINLSQYSGFQVSYLSDLLSVLEFKLFMDSDVSSFSKILPASPSAISSVMFPLSGFVGSVDPGKVGAIQWTIGGSPSFLDIEMGVSTPAVPEPSTMLMLGTGLAGFSGFYRFRLRKSRKRK